MRGTGLGSVGVFGKNIDFIQINNYNTKLPMKALKILFHLTKFICRVKIVNGKHHKNLIDSVFSKVVVHFESRNGRETTQSGPVPPSVIASLLGHSCCLFDLTV